ncbi:hypothetical protein INT47_007385 [Mucor saturninus]|uniref:Uncharacterized protein n=1 Tax=Mucor saturninus TaxID=64648 RepID=A0A8H7QFF4_9FUNG|nr:hypothetical protein INT47_007385 [Mucor saturninus]
MRTNTDTITTNTITTDTITTNTDTSISNTETNRSDNAVWVKITKTGNQRFGTLSLDLRFSQKPQAINDFRSRFLIDR